MGAEQWKTLREIDALVAEKWMGYRWYETYPRQGERYLAPADWQDKKYLLAEKPDELPLADFAYQQVPHYTTETAEAWHVLDTVHEQLYVGNQFSLCSVLIDANGMYWCTITVREPDKEDRKFESFENRLCVAICCAALAVKGIAPIGVKYTPPKESGEP